MGPEKSDTTSASGDGHDRTDSLPRGLSPLATSKPLSQTHARGGSQAVGQVGSPAAAQGGSSATPGDGSPAGGITKEIRETVKFFEKKRNLLYQDEMNLQSRYGELETTFINTLGVYVMMLGGSSVFGSIFLLNRRNVFFIFAILLLTFFMGVGVAANSARRKRKKMDWEANGINGRRQQLKSAAEAFREQLEKVALPSPSESDLNYLQHAIKVIKNIEDSLGAETGGFKDDHTAFINWNLVASVLYALGVAGLAFAFLIQDKQNHLFSGRAPA